MRFFLVLTWILAGCSSNAATTPENLPTAEQATTTCPATLRATNGARCYHRGQICNIPITCDAVNEQVECICDGTFTCSDRIGVIPIGSEAICTPRTSPDERPCPATMAMAANQACETVGKLCTYEGPICPESITGQPSLESCVCRGSLDGSGTKYRCYPHLCLGN